MKIESAACTHVGRRSNNEDAFCADPRLGLFAVADGMGGYEGSEVASRLVIETLTRFFDRNGLDDDVTWPFALDPQLSLGENMVSTAVRLANARVVEHKTGRLASMGSTVATLAVRGRELVLGHVGDSRIYRLRGARFEQLTQDHSLCAEFERAGLADWSSRAECPYANVITRALGMPQGPRPDLRTEPARAGDVYLLCTDGLTETVTDARLADVLAALPPARACAALVAEAFEGGGRDNITAVVLAVRAA
jgi:serine/threonine protein phosphatase PrpC